MRALPLLQHLSRDVRYATRVLRRSPGFTTVAVVSLALGLGVNAAIFSVVQTVLLRPLPYPRADRLVGVGQVGKGDATTAEYEFLKEHTRVFSSIAGHRSGADRRIEWSTGQDWIGTRLVSADFLRTLQVQPALGREFTAEETRATGPQAIILSDGLWRRAFSADGGVVGRMVTVDGVTCTVVGVLSSDVWLPYPVDALLPLRPSGSHSDRGANTQLIARLRDGVTLAQGRTDTMALSQAFRQAHPTDVAPDYAGLGVTRYQDVLVGDVRVNLWLMFAATAALLLIACANLTALMLTRLVSRSKEVAIRLALGGSRGALLTQFLAENILVTALGAAAGLFAGYALLEALVAWMPFSLPAASPLRLNGPVVLFVLAVSAAIALAFTAVPVLAARRLNVQAALQAAGRSGARHVRTRTRHALVVAGIALSTTPLIAAGLLVQSLYRLHQERLGFVPRGLVTFETLAPARRDTPQRLAFTEAMRQALQSLPGVRGVAAVNVLPLTGQKTNLPAQHEGYPDHSIGGMEIRAVTPDYFEVMGIPIQRGRAFADHDPPGSLPLITLNHALRPQLWAP